MPFAQLYHSARALRRTTAPLGYGVVFRNHRVMPLKPMAAELADRLRNAKLTYREVGQTAGKIPPGYHPGAPQRGV